MPTTMRASFVLPLAATLLFPLAQATAQAPARADARADARAEARADGSRDARQSSHSVTHRVVVVNGRTVVDERTENGRPVGTPPGGKAPGPAPMRPDMADMLRKATEEAERALGEQLRRGGGGQPLTEQQERMLRDMRGQLRDQLDRETARDGAKQRASQQSRGDAKQGPQKGGELRRSADEIDRWSKPIPPARETPTSGGARRGLEPRSKPR